MFSKAPDCAECAIRGFSIARLDYREGAKNANNKKAPRICLGAGEELGNLQERKI